MSTSTPRGLRRRGGRAATTGEAVGEPGTAFADAVDAVRHGDRSAADAVDGLLARLTDEELLGMLDGDLRARDVVRGFRAGGLVFPSGAVDRLGIPGLRFTDGPRGVLVGHATSFPVTIARAASWDVGLEREVSAAIGAEARASGANLVGNIYINLAPAPGWGRSQESYGEDPLLLGAMGAAAYHGMRPWALTCVKTFALNTMEEARFLVDVRVEEDVLHEVYLPHFRTVVEAGVDTVMTAYNSVNGQRVGDHHHLLTEVLREEMGFSGVVHSDWVWGLRDPVGSLRAGLDVEMPLRQQRARALPAALQDGTLTRADVLRSARRSLAAQVDLALRARPTPPVEVIASPAHRALARDAARRGAVLLRNEPVGGVPALPLAAGDPTRVAVLGPLADTANLGDKGSSWVRPPATVSLLEGLRERLGDRVLTADGHGIDAAVHAAQGADAAVVVVGLTSEDEGEALLALDEDSFGVFGGAFRWRPVRRLASTLFGLVPDSRKIGGDRRDLHLPAAHVALVRAVAAANPRTVVVVVGGGTIMMDPWDQDVPAVLLAWYPGMEGGRALADVLLGDAEPGGRLPLAIPRRREHLPVVDWSAHRVTYGRWFGQRKLDHDGHPAAYPFGFGLGYTRFALGGLHVGAVDGERFDVDVEVVNTGDRAGRHVVQVYASSTGADGRPVRVLVGFAGTRVDAGASVRLTVPASTRPLQRWTPDGFVTDPDPVVLEVGSYAGDPGALTHPFRPA